MTNIELISFIASIASLILAVIAIVLSIVFYYLSSKNSNETTAAAKDIDFSIVKLEGLFDKLYSGIFGIFQETNSDMRKQLFPDNSITPGSLSTEFENSAEEKLSALKTTVNQDLNKILNRQQMADESIRALNSQMRDLIDKAIEDSRRVESTAREETIQNQIIKTIQYFKKNQLELNVGEITNSVVLNSGIRMEKVVDELFKMIKKKIIIKSGNLGILRPEDLIDLVKK